MFKKAGWEGWTWSERKEEREQQRSSNLRKGQETGDKPEEKDEEKGEQAEKPDTALMDSPISVMFVDNTKGGLLAKKFREEEKRLGRMTGYNVRVAETAGMAISRLLPSTNLWGAGDCGRHDCPVCELDDENTQNCKQCNILSESCCQICQVDGKKTEKERMENSKGVYVGE